MDLKSSISSDKPYIVLNLLADINRRQHVFIWNMLGPQSGVPCYGGYCTSLDYFRRNYLPGRNVILFAHGDEDGNIYRQALDITQNQPVATRRELMKLIINKNVGHDSADVSVFAMICEFNTNDFTVMSEMDCNVHWESAGFDAVSCQDAFNKLRYMNLCRRFQEGALHLFADFFQGIYPYGRGGFGLEFEFFDVAFKIWLLQDRSGTQPHYSVFQSAVKMYTKDYNQFLESDYCHNGGINIATVMGLTKGTYCDALDHVCNFFSTQQLAEHDRERLKDLAERVLKYRLYLKQDVDESTLVNEIESVKASNATTKRYLHSEHVRAVHLWDILWRLLS